MLTDINEDKCPQFLELDHSDFIFIHDERGEPPHIHVATFDGEC